MTKKLTITISDDVYSGLYAKIGAEKISAFLDSLARPHVVENFDKNIDQSYAEMAADEERECDAVAWCETFVHDGLTDEAW